jgi:hypothetical protein
MNTLAIASEGNPERSVTPSIHNVSTASDAAVLTYKDLKRVRRLLSNLRYGKVTLVVEDGKLTCISRTEDYHIER